MLNNVLNDVLYTAQSLFFSMDNYVVLQTIQGHK